MGQAQVEELGQQKLQGRVAVAQYLDWPWHEEPKDTASCEHGDRMVPKSFLLG